MTFCESFGHDYGLMKAYGKTYMECSRCHDIKRLENCTRAELEREPEAIGEEMREDLSQAEIRDELESIERFVAQLRDVAVRS